MSQVKRIVGVIVFILCLTSRMNAQDFHQKIKDCAITAGPWKGTFKENSEGAGFRYYFVNMAMLSVVENPTFSKQIESLLNSCLSQASKNGYAFWNDVPNFQLSVTKIADADDSNAAAFLMLASRYGQTKEGSKWFTSNVENIKKIADKGLLANQLENGLISVFATQRKFDNPEYQYKADKKLNAEQNRKEKEKHDQDLNTKKILQNDAYLMDCCEVYAGLKQLSDTLKKLKLNGHEPFDQAAEKLAAGITNMYHAAQGAFFILNGDVKLGKFYGAESVKFIRTV